jgi:phage major head subunit gpT-like protein
MLINSANLANIFAGFKAIFNQGFGNAPPDYKKIAMIVPSSVREEHYVWLGQFPRLREWLGDRVVRNLIVHGHTIKNRRFESTFEIGRDDIADDQYGALAPLIQELGASAASHPTELTLELLAAGFTNLCYDGQPMFSDSHPSFDQNGLPITASNLQAGTGPAWFLLDNTRPFRAMIYQEREPYHITVLNREEEEDVFMHNRFLYGVTGRSNAGYGLWQLAFGSQAELTADNYGAARAAMASLRGDGGRKLNINPSLLVVPRELEGPGRSLINGETRVITVDVGTPPLPQSVPVSNEWKGSAELLATSYL